MAVFGVRKGPIGFAAPWRFKILDSQPDSLNMGPVPTDVHEICDFQKSYRGFLTRNSLFFGLGASKTTYSTFSVGTEKMRDEKICRPPEALIASSHVIVCILSNRQGGHMLILRTEKGKPEKLVGATGRVAHLRSRHL